MSFLATARKWRPMVFDDVVGQSHVTTTLRNAISTTRLAHAYIFSGSRGCGKTTTARILAKAINCLHPEKFNPDNSCDLCVEITENRSVNVFEIDGASNRGVEDIRNLREAVRYAPAKGAYKVYIIDEVHMLTKEAFNALLKTLEEPPSYVVFIFATTEIHKVPPTILSRCQRFDFRRIAIDAIIASLRVIAKEEKITIDDDALLVIAKRADGSMRDAQSIFDQIIASCGKKVVSKQIVSMLNIVDEELFFRATQLIRTKDVKGGLLLAQEVFEGGADIREYLNGLLEHLRNILVVRSTGSTKLVEASELTRKRYQDDALSFSENDLLRLIKLVSEAEGSMRWSQQPRLRLEITLTQMIKMDGSIEIGNLLLQLEEVKKKLNSAKVSTPIDIPASRNAHETKPLIRGSVKATQPTLRPDQIVLLPATTPQTMSLHQRLSPIFRSPGTTALDNAPHLEPIPQLGTEDVQGKWGVFVEEARKERVAIGTMLSESSFLEMRDGRIQIGCPDDFHMDQLTRNRHILSGIAERVYGAKVSLETIITKHTPSTLNAPTIVKRDDGTTPDGSTSSPLKQHPVVRALMQEFAAVEVG